MNIDLKPRPRWAPTLLALALVSPALAACGSSSHPSSRTTAAFKVAPIEAPCQQVSAVLSDGPDPDADPVGYAQAQILPLRALKLSDPKLTHAVNALATAYDRLSESGGSAADKPAVSKAETAVNHLCPGAAS